MRNQYLEKFQKLIKDFNLDAIVIYANGYDDRFMKALSGTYSILQNHILITKKECFITSAHYLSEELKKKSRLPIVSAPGEDKTFQPIASKVGFGKRIGIIGNCKFKDIIRCKPAHVKELTDHAEKIIMWKSDSFIFKIKEYSNLLSEIVREIRLSGGMNQIALEEKIKRSIVKKRVDIAFPICITSGEDLKVSTTFSASDKSFHKRDCVCLDIGIKSNIFTTDLTRMFFINNQKALETYNRIKKAHDHIIQRELDEFTTRKQLLTKYRSILGDVHTIKKVSGKDFSHGIGFALHEYCPFDEDKKSIGRNVVFTLEPTFFTDFGLMRIEDMVGILSDGKVISLTSL